MEIPPATLELLEQRSSRSTNKVNKRNKVSKACNECRKKKVRCDGAQPCEKCIKTEIECNFSNVLPRKGPPKEYLEPFESRLKVVDSVLQTIHKNDTPRSIRLNSAPTPVDSYLSISSIGYAPYVPELPSRLDRIEPCYFTENNLNVEPLQPRLNIKPQVPMRFDLIETYFDHIHPSIPFVDKISVTTPQPPSLLLNAIYAAASKFHHQDQKTNDPPGWSYYKMAFSLIEIYMDTPRLSTIQALLLLVKYHEYIQRPGFFWRTKYLIQIATQMAGDLGLSREPVDNNTDMYTLECRNRTFWAVYMYETLMSTEQGSKPYFRPEECTAHYPQYINNQNNDNYEDILNFHWTSKVVHTQGFVLQFMRSKYSTDTFEIFDEQKEFKSLEEDLNNLGHNIPKILSPDTDINVYFIHLIYHVVTILLYRPYINTNPAQDSPYNLYCQSSASSITDMVEKVLTLKEQELVYSTVRGYQQIIYCLTAAITIQRAAKNTVTALQLFDLSEYEKTASVLNMVIAMSPVTEIDEVSASNSQLWVDTKRKQEIALSSNTSSARSSPLDISLSYSQSPSPKITKKVSISSMQFPSTPDSISYTSPSSNSIMPEHTVYQRTQPATNRLARAKNRLSAPPLTSLYQQHPNYYPQPMQQSMYPQPMIHSPQQHLTSHSQPTSPISQYFTDIISASTPNGNTMDQFYNTSSLPRRSLYRRGSLKRSTSFVGDFTIPVQRPTRTTSSRPYINGRRHTMTNSVAPNLMDTVMSSGPTSVKNSNSNEFYANNRYSAPPNTLFPYDIPLATQQVMMDPSFPMDPVIPHAPNESMMRILMNKDRNLTFSNQQHS